MSHFLEVDEAAVCTRPDAWTWWVNFTTSGPGAPGQRPIATITVVTPGVHGDLMRVEADDAEVANEIRLTLMDLGAPAAAVRRVTS